MGPTEHLEIDEHDDGEFLHLRVRGELDLGTAPELEARLLRAREQRRAVRLDLSGLGFMDSTGVSLLVTGVRDASLDGWHLEIDPSLSPAVACVIELTRVRELLFGAEHHRSRESGGPGSA